MPVLIKSRNRIDKTIYTPFYDWVLKHAQRYLFWKNGLATWQLRIVGGPGSGKTTLSGLIIEDLLKSEKKTIVSIFLEEPKQTDEEEVAPENPNHFSTRFLGEVLRQLLTADEQVDAQAHSQVHAEISSINIANIEAVRKAISERFLTRKPVFLLVDDLDILATDRELYHQVEKELDWLQSNGWHVMATSRISFPYRDWIPSCDVVQTPHMDANTGVWWQCEPCGEEQYFICDDCKEEGHGCRDHSTLHLVQPVNPEVKNINIDIGNAPGMHHFVSHQLQIEHGYLGLKTTIGQYKECDFPPLSDLGKSLNASKAEKLVQTITDQAEGNVALALMRLEHIRDFTTAEEALAVSDRLPSAIVAAFTAGLDRISRRNGRSQKVGSDPQAEAKAQPPPLGLEVIAFVATEKSNNGMMWRNLKDQLVKHGWRDDITEDDILATTAGFLKENLLDGHTIKCYHNDFMLFASENYHNGLSKITLSHQGSNTNI